MSIQDNINDYNLNVVDNTNPRLIGYLPLDYFQIVDTDHSSVRIRDVAIPIEQFYDYNLKNACCDCADANGGV